jgi:Tfp pilus assembly protein PilO
MTIKNGRDKFVQKIRDILKSEYIISVLAVTILIALGYVYYSAVLLSNQEKSEAKKKAESQKIEYQKLVNAETSKVKMQSDQLVEAFRVSIRALDSRYAPSFSQLANGVADVVADPESIIRLISYLVWDTLKTTNEAEELLEMQVKPLVNPVVSNYQKSIRFETSKLDDSLHKITVQLATDIAAIGPSGAQSTPKPVSAQENTPEYKELLDNLGKNAASPAIDRAFEGLLQRMWPSLIKQIRSVAFRMFGFQIARVTATLPVVVTGPAAIFFQFANGAWLVYQVISLQPDFKVDVATNLTTNFDAIRSESRLAAYRFATARATEVQSIQTVIGNNALKSLEKLEIK